MLSIAALRRKQKAARLHARKTQLLGSVPGLLGSRSLLYVGANVERMEMLDLFIAKKRRITVLEAWAPNVDALRRWNESRRVIAEILEGDVRALDAEKRYDIVMWWHGPEHISAEELDATLERVERAARRYVVLAAPFGNVPQGATGGNPHERHLAAYLPETFIVRGYEVNTIGKIDWLGSNLLAWKRV